MKKLTHLLAVGIVATSCQTKQSEEKTTTTDTTTVAQAAMAGNDLDKHGCKGSAGYTWSVAKNECVQIFEAGVRLDAADSTLNQTLSAFAVFVNDEKENEFDFALALRQHHYPKTR